MNSFTRNFLILLMLLALNSWGQEKIHVSQNLDLYKVSESCFVHSSYSYVSGYGQIRSNGLIVTDNNQALLFDTPMSDSVTAQLARFLMDSMQIEIIGFVPNHSHNDCTEGMDVLEDVGVESYALRSTNKILLKEKRPVAMKEFKDSLSLEVGKIAVHCYYLGKAHAPDNIVTWVPTDKVLFTGCMVRPEKAERLGNIADADIDEWPETLKRVQSKFPEALIVIPGHGVWGDITIINHTLNLLDKGN